MLTEQGHTKRINYARSMFFIKEVVHQVTYIHIKTSRRKFSLLILSQSIIGISRTVVLNDTETLQVLPDMQYEIIIQQSREYNYPVQ